MPDPQQQSPRSSWQIAVYTTQAAAVAAAAVAVAAAAAVAAAEEEEEVAVAAPGGDVSRSARNGCFWKLLVQQSDSLT
jgi:hypothetical protein